MAEADIRAEYIMFTDQTAVEDSSDVLGRRELIAMGFRRAVKLTVGVPAMLALLNACGQTGPAYDQAPLADSYVRSEAEITDPREKAAAVIIQAEGGTAHGVLCRDRGKLYLLTAAHVATVESQYPLTSALHTTITVPNGKDAIVVKEDILWLPFRNDLQSKRSTTETNYGGDGVVGVEITSTSVGEEAFTTLQLAIAANQITPLEIDNYQTLQSGEMLAMYMPDTRKVALFTYIGYDKVYGYIKVAMIEDPLQERVCEGFSGGPLLRCIYADGTYIPNGQVVGVLSKSDEQPDAPYSQCTTGGQDGGEYAYFSAIPSA